MKRIETRGIAALVAVAMGVAALAGCGGSSSSSTSASTSAQTQAAGQNAGRRGAIAACLRQQGVTLPQRPAGGQRGQGAGGLFGGPAAGRFSDPKVRAALQKCGLSRHGPRLGGAAFKQRLTKFTACVRANGYNLPNPNTSGKGPVFDPTNVNRTDPRFLTAVAKCQSLLRFGRGQGAPGGQGSGPPPGSGAGGA